MVFCFCSSGDTRNNGWWVNWSSNCSDLKTSHLLYGLQGVGLVARISRKLQKKTHVMVMLKPKQHQIIMKGNVLQVEHYSISLCYSKVFSPFRICNPCQNLQEFYQQVIHQNLVHAFRLNFD